MTVMYRTRAEYEQRLIALHQALFSDAVQAQLTAAIAEKQSRESIALAGMESQMRMLFNRMELDQASTQLLAETERIRYVALSEYEGATLDLNARDALWEFEVYTLWIDAVSSVLGGAKALPKGTSRAASALGGALTGAGTGAAAGTAIGAAGGPIGAGVGALIGGGIGLLGGLLA